MPEITQGQRDTPYEGKTIFSARVAGRETPTGTGLTPEAEHMIRLELIKKIAESAKLKMELANQSITSRANIAVAVQNAMTKAIGGAIEMARLGQMSNSKLQDTLLTLADMEGSIARSAGRSFEDKSYKAILNEARGLERRNVASGQGSIAEEIEVLRRGNATPQMVVNAIKLRLTQQNGIFSNAVAAPIAHLRRSGADIITLVDTQNFAKEQMAIETQKGYQAAIDKLSTNSAWDTATRNLLLDPNKQAEVVSFAVEGAATGQTKKDVFASTSDKRAAAEARAAGSVEAEALRRTFLDMSVGVPPHISKAFNDVLNISTGIVEEGPVAFARSLETMPVPLSVQMTEQKLQYQLDQLDNPTDKLSQAVAGYASKIPHFATYMAAMGMEDPYDAVMYLREHPEDRKEYFRTVKTLYDANDFEGLRDPVALQERLRVAGSSDATSIFRTRGLTKPIERLLGIGVNRPEAWRYFSGRNTTEQLQTAIAALSNPDFDAQVAAMEVEEAERGGPQDPEEANIPQKTIDFVKSLPEKRRKRVLTAAQKYLSRVDPEYEIEGEDPGSGRVLLQGVEPEPYEPDPPPAVAPVQAAVEEEPKVPVSGFGTKRWGSTLEGHKEDIHKERTPAPTAAADDTEIDLSDDPLRPRLHGDQATLTQASAEWYQRGNDESKKDYVARLADMGNIQTLYQRGNDESDEDYVARLMDAKTNTAADRFNKARNK